MLKASPHKLLNILAIFSAVYWLSLAIDLPPIAASPDFEKLASEIYTSEMVDFVKEVRPELNLPKDKLIEKWETSFFIQTALQYIVIGLGLLAAMLIYLRRKPGKYLAISLFVILLCFKISTLWKFAANFNTLKAWLWFYFGEFFQTWPMAVINDLVSILLSVTMVYFLMNRPISKQFEKDHLTSP